jgi:hypothetical protein
MKSVLVVMKEDLTEDGQKVWDGKYTDLNRTHLQDWSVMQKYDRVVVRKGAGFIVISDFGGKAQYDAGTVISLPHENLYQ